MKKLTFEAVQHTFKDVFQHLAYQTFSTQAFEQGYGLNLLAVDSVSLRIQDNEENRAEFGRD